MVCEVPPGAEEPCFESPSCNTKPGASLSAGQFIVVSHRKRLSKRRLHFSKHLVDDLKGLSLRVSHFRIRLRARNRGAA